VFNLEMVTASSLSSSMNLTRPGGGYSHEASHKRGVVVVLVHVRAVELKVEVKLEDPILELSSVSMVKARPGNLVATGLGFVRGIHRSITYLEGV
jgi:hypothetical protein